MKHLQLFEEWHSEKTLEEIQEELEMELDWVNKYSEYIDEGRFPEDDYNSEAEFYDDLERTENRIEELKGQIKEKESANEGFFNFTGPLFNRGVIDFTKPMQTASQTRSRSRWWKRRSQETPKKTNQRPFYGVQEEEEEELPYSKQKYVRRPQKPKNSRMSDEEYWSDENVKARQERSKTYRNRDKK
jgi:hypothetical protein